MTFIVLLGSNYRTETGIEGVEQQLPRLLSRYGKVYCFEYPQFKKSLKILNGSFPLFEKIGRNLHIFRSCGLLPYGRSVPYINRLNHVLNYRFFQRVMKTISSPIITIAFTPEVVYLPHLINRSEKVFYYVTDNYYALPFWSGRGGKQLSDLESSLLPNLKGIITASYPLVKKYRKLHKNVHLYMTPSSNLKAYAKASRENTIPADLARLPRPIVGFVGSVYDWKIDLPLLVTLLTRYPRYSFVFVGTLQIKNRTRKLLQNYGNFHFLGFKDIRELPAYIASFDVCMIPYIQNSWGHAAYPVKVNQYLAAGKPIVSTAIESLQYLHDVNLIYWSKNHKEFIGNMGKAVREDMKDKKIVRARIKEGMRNDWSVRIREYMKIITS